MMERHHDDAVGRLLRDRAVAAAAAAFGIELLEVQGTPNDAVSTPWVSMSSITAFRRLTEKRVPRWTAYEWDWTTVTPGAW